MEAKEMLGKIVAACGVFIGIAGILATIWFYFTLGGVIDGIRDSALAQTRSLDNILMNAGLTVDYAEDTVNSFASFAGNTSSTLDSYSEALYGMGQAMEDTASGLGMVPLMPSGAISGLRQTGSDMKEAAAGMGQTSQSAKDVGDSASSATFSLSEIKGEIENARASITDTEMQINEMHSQSRLALLVLSILMIALFSLNILMFAGQFR